MLCLFKSRKKPNIFELTYDKINDFIINNQLPKIRSIQDEPSMGPGFSHDTVSLMSDILPLLNISIGSLGRWQVKASQIGSF